jgi:hypothetical protein
MDYADLRILSAFVAWRKDHDYPPTLRWLSDEVCLSLCALHRRLRLLEARGLLTSEPNAPRTRVLTEAGKLEVWKGERR